jgi:TolB-like protein
MKEFDMNKMFKVAIVAFFVLINTCLSFAYEKEIKGISSAISEDIAKAGKKTIAVVDFTDLQGNMTELGRFLAEELSVDLTLSAKGFEVIDRTHLKSILTEHKLSVTGLVDPNTVKKLGQIAGVNAIVTGSVTPFGDSIRVTCKVIATDTAKVIGASKSDIAKTKAIEELLAKGIETGTTSTQGTGTTTSKSQPKAMPKVEVNDFSFLARECKMSGQKVTCIIAVTNNAQETKELTIFAWENQTLLVDDRGHQFNTDELSFGGGGKIGGKEGYSAISRDIPVGLPMNIVFKYSGVPPSVTQANLIIGCSSQGIHFKAVLRNIPLTK